MCRPNLEAAPMATQLRKIWLSVHSLTWLALPPDNRERMDRKWNQFVERIPFAYPLEQKLQREYQRAIDAAGYDEAVYFLPTHFEAADEIIEYADARLGDRSMVSRVEGGPAAKERSLGSDFFQGIEDDQRAAIRNRGLADGVLTADQLRQDGASRDASPDLPPGGLQATEIRGWMQAKAWGLDLLAQAESRGLEFDPATVEMEAFGGDWSYCAASFPIQIGRAMSLANPIERRFDLINPAEGPVLLQSEVVEQNIPLADNIRLFIWGIHRFARPALRGAVLGGHPRHHGPHPRSRRRPTARRRPDRQPLGIPGSPRPRRGHASAPRTAPPQRRLRRPHANPRVNRHDGRPSATRCLPRRPHVGRDPLDLIPT